MVELKVVAGARARDDERDERVESSSDRVAQGDLETWSRLYQEHFDGLFRHLCYLTGDPSVTEELVQETFAVALSRVAAFRGESTFST